jgi:hypothetical protein
VFHINIEQQQMFDNANNAKKTTLAPKAKRCVSFYHNVHVNLTLHIRDYTEEERKACWYNMGDVKEFKKDIRFTVNAMERNREINEKYHCRRGLEFKTRVGATSVFRNRKMALIAVLKEQIIQGSENKSANLILAAVYQDAVQQSRMFAYLTGLSDEKEALAGLDSTTLSTKSTEKSRKRSLNVMRRTWLPKIVFSSAA